ncbi:MAG: hypothetical protein RL122_48 [Pseudomonadota bacterium]|jgi:hypothetical protein
MRERSFLVTISLLAGLLLTSAATAASVTSVQKGQQREDTTTIAESVGMPETLSAAPRGFLPGLIGPHLYLYLLQSDQFITLQGLIEDYRNKNIIKTH